MNVYVLEREDWDYDEYETAVVLAVGETEAIFTPPNRDVGAS